MPERVDIEPHFGLVRGVCARFKTRGSLTVDDLFQVGCIGLLKASRTFDAARGLKFGTYAAWCIYGEVSHAVRSDRIAHGATPDEVRKRPDRALGSKRRQKRRRSHLTVRIEDMRNDEEHNVFDAPAPPEAPVCESVPELDALYLSKLAPRRRAIVRRVVFEGHKLADIAREQGVSRCRIDQLYHAGLDDLRERWAHKRESA